MSNPTKDEKPANRRDEVRELVREQSRQVVSAIAQLVHGPNEDTRFNLETELHALAMIALDEQHAASRGEPRPWDEGGRDDYFSKLPGDARLVAGLEPSPEPALCGKVWQSNSDSFSCLRNAGHEGQCVDPRVASPEPAPVESCLCYRCSGGIIAGDPLRQVMVLCPRCGNKRCPKADWHGFRCSGSNDLNQTGEPELVEPPVPVAGGTERILVNGVPRVVLRDKRERECEPPVPVAGLREYDLRVFHLTGELSAVSKEASEHATARIELLRERDEAVARVEALKGELYEARACGSSLLAAIRAMFIGRGWSEYAVSDVNLSGAVLSCLQSVSSNREALASANARAEGLEKAVAHEQKERAWAMSELDAAIKSKAELEARVDRLQGVIQDVYSLARLGEHRKYEALCEIMMKTQRFPSDSGEPETKLRDPWPPAAAAGESGEGRA